MSKQSMKITYGCDPEFFIKKDGQFVSPYGVIPGNKNKPFPVSKGAIQVDGLAVEFNIAPVSSISHFSIAIDKVLTQLCTKITEEGYSSDFSTKAEFSTDYWEVIPSFQKRIGCDPDYSAYTQSKNSYAPDLSPVRYAGGHVHIGWTEGKDIEDELHFLNCCEVAKYLDICLGYHSLFVDKDKDRIKTYGQPGNFRPKPYGIEYRTLSNFWIQNPLYRHHVANGCRWAMLLLHDQPIDLDPDLFKIMQEAFYKKSIGQKITKSAKFKSITGAFDDDSY